jgi:hypothetical protein
MDEAVRVIDGRAVKRSARHRFIPQRARHEFVDRHLPLLIKPMTVGDKLMTTSYPFQDADW